jgi:hypothetical protein
LLEDLLGRDIDAVHLSGVALAIADAVVFGLALALVAAVALRPPAVTRHDNVWVCHPNAPSS